MTAQEDRLLQHATDRYIPPFMLYCINAVAFQTSKQNKTKQNNTIQHMMSPETSHGEIYVVAAIEAESAMMTQIVIPATSLYPKPQRA